MWMNTFDESGCVGTRPVLTADDPVRRELRTFFEEAVEGFEALRLIGELRPDVVLLDLKVSRTGGLASWNVWPMSKTGRG